jgi:CDP-diacylglycerol--glycerol-3-phosphate 3-phosphatidyltransferase
MKLHFEPTIPNYLTTLRLLAIPFMARAICAGAKYNTLAFILFLAIWSTDLLDGYIARHYHQVSDFGKVFDPLVDKIFQLTMALTFYLTQRLPLWVLIFMLAKELMMIFGGYFLLRDSRTIVQAHWYGKLATVLLVAAFATLFLLPPSLSHVAGVIFILPVGWALVAYILYGVHYILPYIRQRKGT